MRLTFQMNARVDGKYLELVERECERRDISVSKLATVLVTDGLERLLLDDKSLVRKAM